MTSAEPDPLAAHLAELPPEELVRRLLEVARRHDDVRFALESEAQAAAGRFDLAAAKKQLTAQVAVRGGYLPRGAARGYAQDVAHAADTLAALLEAGLAGDVVVLCEYVMKRLDTALGKVDDSGGYLAAPFERLKELHHAACLGAGPDPKKLAVRMVEQALKSSDAEWFLDAPMRYRDVLGEEGLAAYRARLEREWETLPPRLPSTERGWAPFDGDRFRVTYLREQLARAEGNVDELVAVLAHDRSSAYQFVRIADVLDEAGREREALSWLERGLAAFPPVADARLRRRLIDAYLRDGQVDDAVALAERTLRAEPTAASYAVLREVAGATGDWPARRESSLELLRAAPRDPSAPAHVRMLARGADQAVLAQLEEGDVEGAWRDARADGCTQPTWLRLADQSRTSHPESAARVYLDAIGRALEHASASSYETAAELLEALRDTLVPAGQADAFAAEVERVREANRRRPRLLAILDSHGLG